MKKRIIILLAVFILAGMSLNVAAKDVKIGFLVKQPEEAWFQDEWKFAEAAANDYDFELVKIGATDGEKVLSAIDNLASQGAQGFIICTPDVKLGPAIAAKANMNKLKFMSVDDRFVGSNGKVMEEVHHMGISAYNIGKLVGKTLVEQMDNRNWDYNDVGYLVMTYDQLPTISERTQGATDVLLENAFPEANIFDSPMKTLDTEGSFNAANFALTKHSNINKWIVAGGNDSSVIGAIRALEGQGFGANDVIGIGINGSNFVINEFEKDEPTGFYASVKLSARQHGYETAELMYKWINEDKEPPKVTWTSGTIMTRDNYQELN
ncbi:arabinose ABC transporter substrate-binding protein [Halanaerobium salsuginis]|uniref:L-arabinose-binding protein n=1 Tax=Halanaerobium salsuginis TaxID=29563 RepID=A0A1I4HH52_9FIRM|nr:arabinose ABC transporter substrate-binding protein [Halanaerobium salsuginis]SFL40706.1 L-arabinose-binding protein [Halanaerobium salsuginis]